MQYYPLTKCFNSRYKLLFAQFELYLGSVLIDNNIWVYLQFLLASSRPHLFIKFLVELFFTTFFGKIKPIFIFWFS